MARSVLAAAAFLMLATTADAQVYVIKPAQPQINWGLLQTPDYAGNAMRAMAEGQAMAAARQQAQQQQAQSQAALDAQQTAGYAALHKADVNKLVGGLIADGNCDGARNEALRAGDFDLARQVADLCKATQ